MFLKRMTHGLGRRRVYWRLVESFRTARGPRHRTVAYLGELRPGERLGWARLSRILDGKAAAKAQQLSLCEPLGAGAAEVPDSVEVELKGVRVGRSRDFGDVFVALAVWRMLGLDEFFARELPAGREEVPWAAMACVLALARFLEPDSELHIEDTWYRRSSRSPQRLETGVEESRGVASLVRTERGLLHAAQQHHRPDAGATLENVHPVDGSGGGLLGAERRTACAADLAPA